MIINESRSFTDRVGSLRVNDIFIEDDGLHNGIGIYKVSDIASHKNGSLIISVDDLISKKSSEIIFDTDDRVHLVKNNELNNELRDFRWKHFIKDTGLNVVHDYNSGSYIVTGCSERDLNNSIRTYNRKYRTDIRSLGINNEDGSLHIVFNEWGEIKW